MTAPSRVLIVDPSPDSREVLRALVERVGAEAVEAEHAEQALTLAERSAPDLIVLDTDSDPSAEQTPARDLGFEASRTDTPIVVLGTLKRSNGWPGADQRLPKPYHYGPLLRRIEGLLAARSVS